MNEASGAHWKSGQASSGLLSLRDSKYLPMALEASQMTQEEFDLWPPRIQQELVPMFLSAWDHNKRTNSNLWAATQRRSRQRTHSSKTFTTRRTINRK